jgi:aspartate/methionine/tyrosine aminotransferase
MTQTQPEAFYRERRLAAYVFAEVNRLKAAYRQQGRDVIDFGMGNPDLPPAPHIIAKLAEVAADPRAHRYSASAGVPSLRKALSRYYERRFNVGLDPEREVCVTLGSKEGLANLAQAITAPGDVILAPDPSYPIHMFGFIIAGAAVRPVSFDSPEDFLREADHACRRSIPSPSALVLNFPSNPTAQVVDLDFYAEAVKLAKAHDLVLISDLAYSEIYFDGGPPPSILEVPGRARVAVEFTSMSKTYSMPGWRIGFAAGIGAADRCAQTGEILSRLRRLHAGSDRRGGGAGRPAGQRGGRAPNLSQPPRRAGGKLRPGRLRYPQTARHHVRLGADPGAVCASRLGGVLQAAAGENRRRRGARPGFWRARRQPCAPGFGGE